MAEKLEAKGRSGPMSNYPPAICTNPLGKGTGFAISQSTSTSPAIAARLWCRNQPKASTKRSQSGDVPVPWTATLESPRSLRPG